MTPLTKPILHWVFRAVLALWILPGHAASHRPNIVFILADDLGYGDVRCLNPASRIATPHLDRLAADGKVFTDAHSSSSVCTPTRYGILTGRYNWRSRLKNGVQGGMSPPLIEPGRWTVASFLKQQGYHTACIGKWHLGMEWPLQPGAAPFADTIEQGRDGWRVDFAQPIRRGPNSVGFDHFFGIAASLDMVPYTYIENDRVTSLPVGDKAFPMMSGRTNGATRRGPAAADFEAVDVLPTLTRQAIQYLERRADAAKGGHPFFLYLPLTSPHTPIAASPEWENRSGLNAYADFVMQTDASVGDLLGALDRLGLSKDTLVIFTSDNGCSPEAKFGELAAAGHRPSGPFRGHKADIFEGGHRVPFIARWPGTVKPGTRSDQLLCLNDLLATSAEILGEKLPDTAGEDSISFLSALRGRSGGPRREALVHHSINGSFALRSGPWKLALCPDSGGWSEPSPGSRAATNLPPVQLYNLTTDPGETNNLQASRPDLVARLTAVLDNYVTQGRSIPGQPQLNTTPVPRRAAGGPGGPPRRPNVLLLLADQWRPQAFGFAGDPNVRTPNFDRLAAESVRFPNAVSGMPVCSPTRASLLTGQRPLTHGVFLNDVQLSTNAVSLPRVFKASGYDTGIIGKWHVDGRGRQSFIPPERRQGYDYWRVQECTHDYLNSEYYADTPEKRRWPGYDALAQTRDACEYLRQHATGKSAKPFLLQLAWGPPHDPYFTAPEKYRALYSAASMKLRPNVPPGLEGEVAKILAGYYAHCTALDDCLGELLQTLEDTGLAQDTLLLFSADHGDMLGSQGLFKKQKPFNESVGVPMLFRWPTGLGSGSRELAAPINTEDLMPTLLGLCGLPIPGSVEGLDFSGYLRGGPNPGDDATVILCASPFGEWERRVGGREYRGVRTPRHTYVRDLNGPWLLFDNQVDPYQTNNLAALPAHQKLQIQLDEVLQRKLRERGDAFLPGPEYIRQWGYTVDANGTVRYRN